VQSQFTASAGTDCNHEQLIKYTVCNIESENNKGETDGHEGFFVQKTIRQVLFGYYDDIWGPSWVGAQREVSLRLHHIVLS